MSSASWEPDPVLSAPGATGRAENALHGIYEISKILGEPGRLEAVLLQVMQALSGFFDMRRGLLALLEDTGDARAVVGVGWQGGAKSHFMDLPEHFVGKIVRQNVPVVVEDVASDRAFAAWLSEEPGEGVRIVLIGAPIQHHGHVIGTLVIDRLSVDASNHLTEEDARFLVMIGSMIGQTLHLYDVVTRDRGRMMDEQRRLEKEPPRPSIMEGEHSLVGIVGASQAIRAVFSQINVAARTHTTLLLRGESGTGKELFARAAHDLSPRKDGPFIRLNCAALSESMLESELFGHEKGSFTGALGQRKGRFELADQGTLFLDEISEVSQAFQAKLLRVLQEGEFERVGGSKTIKVDVRFVFATNRNLEEAVERGAFRADLYYRINVVSIVLPPLRERGEDVPLLAQEFLRRFNEENSEAKQLTAPALRLLQGCFFPGNVRELENCIRRAATMSRDARIGPEDFACMSDSCLSSTLWKDFGGAPGAAPLPISAAALPAPRRGVRGDLDGGGSVAFERERLIDAMEKAGWVQAKAARLLSLTPRQIAYALVKHQIPIKKF
jgi:Nif-specific regulatory protein